MSSFKNKVFKIRMHLLKFTNQIRYCFANGVTVNVVSCDKYQYKIKDDLMLQKYLLKAGYKAKVSSWEKEEKADIMIIRSVWGYHKTADAFLKFVNNNNTINSRKLIVNNIDKQKEFNLLISNGVQPVDTLFFDNIKEFKYNGGKKVIKPIISASGDNTYIIESESDLSKAANIKGIMIQPFEEGINEGEISVICLNGVIKYAIKRYPGVFSAYKKETFISKDNIELEIKDIVQKVISIKEYQSAVFMRVDFVKTKQGYRVMEVELIDPDLYIETIPDQKLKKEVYEQLVLAVEGYLSKVEK